MVDINITIDDHDSFKSSDLYKYLHIEYDERTDSVFVCYADKDGRLYNEFEDDALVLSRKQFLKMFASFKSMMLTNGFGDKIKGYLP